MDEVRAQAREAVRRYARELFARDDNGARVLSLPACGVNVEYFRGDFHVHKYTVPAFSDEQLWTDYAVAVEHLALRGVEVLATANVARERHALGRVMPHAPPIRRLLLLETCLFVVAGAARLVMEVQDIGRCNHSLAFVPHCVLRRMHAVAARLREEAQTATQAGQPQLSRFITATTTRHALPCICTPNTPPCAQNNLVAFQGHGCARCWTLVYTGARDTLFWRVIGPHGGLVFYDREDDGADHNSLTEVPAQHVAEQVRASIASSSELLLSRPGVGAEMIAAECCCVRCLMLKKRSWLFGSVLRHELFITSPRLVAGGHAFTGLLMRLRHLDAQFSPPLSPFASALFADTEQRLALFARMSDEDTARALFDDAAFLALLCELSAEASTIAAAVLVNDAEVDVLWQIDPHSEIESVIEPGSGAWLYSLFAQEGVVAQVLAARDAKLIFLGFRLLSMMIGA